MLYLPRKWLIEVWTGLPGVDQGTEGLGLVTRPSRQAPREAEWPVRGLSQLPSGGPNPEPFLFLGPWPSCWGALAPGSRNRPGRETYLLIPGEPVSGGMGHFQQGYFEDVGTRLMGGVRGQDLMALDLIQVKQRNRRGSGQNRKEQNSAVSGPPVTGLKHRPVTSTGRWLNGVPLSSCSSRQPSE